MEQSSTTSGLARQMGLLALASTGICSMLGASIYVVPFMIQRNVPGIGPYVLPAFVFAAIPAVLAAVAYSILASAMPRAGGSYIYASRGLHPYLGFAASFSQWFGLSIIIGVVSYVIVPFARDVASSLGYSTMAAALDQGPLRLALSLGLLWLFVWINIRGASWYERTVVPLMVLMFVLGAIVIVAGFGHASGDFAAALLAKEGRTLDAQEAVFSWPTLLSAAAILFSSFIGFDSIAQAGGEARNPGRNLPLAIGIAVISVGSFYMLFTGAVYHAIPWYYVAQEAAARDITAPGMMSILLSPGWTVAVIAGAGIALTNDLPAMLLSCSRLMFAWAEDGIFPRVITKVHPAHKTPHIAIVLSGAMATLGILGSHFAGDFFLGVDIMVTSMLVNFLLMCATVLTLPKVNPALAADIRFLPGRAAQRWIAGTGVLILSGFLSIHLYKDATSSVSEWYFHSTPVWLIVMSLATIIYFKEYRRLKAKGADPDARFSQLPPE